jgi:microsomal dipeptidase-like Zn-dependent dipeptidase
MLKLGGEHSISFGADFFCIEDLPPHLQKPLDVLFFPSFNHAGCYGRVLEMWRNRLSLSESSLRDICYGNFFRFIKGAIRG